MIKDNDYVSYLQSPIGFMEIRANKKQIIGIQFVEKRDSYENTNFIIQEALKQLEEYFMGERKNFNFPFKFSGTLFQKRVWEELIKVPYGETLSYGDIAKSIGNFKASRAVGNANNKNKLLIVIPCHRIIGADGNLRGYRGEVWRKKWLLKHENKYLL
ncbi:methylated-DNA--[protein]-cysteine S-methyltransferase [Garciella nitratireducens]|uniref:methylated-DNA--[protein]-cysteine S-methyltransferase n=1 Tax=Garciella nitratireducens TaxID=218205 RepID=UPI000DE9215C|nr:methylated-DNA--[protein]-cysteine S-methyltransferase [Garciella nitratireducens]RBP44995.1 methylated-DNA-[protein]-cysteine S-methyltransferase [Garciella nitratireducens]